MTLSEQFAAYVAWNNANPENAGDISLIYSSDFNRDPEEICNRLGEKYKIKEQVFESVKACIKNAKEDEVVAMYDPAIFQPIAEDLEKEFPGESMFQAVMLHTLISAVSRTARQLAERLTHQRAMEEAMEEVLGGIGESDGNREESNP